MAITREHATIVVGADTSAVGTAMRGVTREFDSLGNTLKNKMGSFLSVAFAGVLLNRVGEFTDKLKGLKKTTGLTIDTLQGLSRMANVNSSSAAAVATSMSFLSDKIGSNDAALKKWGITTTTTNGQLKTTDEILFDIADRMKNAGSETERASIATDLLGRSGRELVPTLGQGSEAIKEFTANITKLTKSEVKAVADAKDELQSLGDTAMVVAGKVIAAGRMAFLFAKNLAKQIKNPSSEMSSIDAAVMDTLSDFHGKYVAPMRTTQPEHDRLAVLKKQQTVYEEHVKLVTKIWEMQNNLRTTKEDRARFGIEELATSQFQFGGALGVDQQRARSVMMFRQRAEWFRQRGMLPQAEANFGAADTIAKQIESVRSGERNPYAQQERAIAEAVSQNDKLTAIYKLLSQPSKTP